MTEKKTQVEELLERISKTEELLEKISKNLENTNKGIETNKEDAGYTKDSKIIEPKVNETKPSETKSKKIVTRSVPVALGIICIILAVCLVGAFAYYTPIVNDKNNTISSLNSQVTILQNQTLSDNYTINSLNTQIQALNNTISSLKSQISQLNSTVSHLLNQSEPYIHSQLLQNSPTTIGNDSVLSGWILNWTPTTDIRIIRIQVWMGNPDNVVWEGDTYVTIGKPSSLSNSSSYNDTTQLLVHYQFDSHAPSSIPHQLIFDLTPGFQVASGQAINVWRAFANTEPYPVVAGDAQVIIYYENT